jgi:putative ABC transport system substrate-binding protein
MSTRRTFIGRVGAAVLATPLTVKAQQTASHRIGVVYYGGPYQAVIDGLRSGLKELGLEEGKQVVLDIRDAKGDLSAVETAARSLEREKVDLIHASPTSVARAVKRVTTTVPIVFCAGADPVGNGLVASYARPGGRLTGITFLGVDLTAKRLELLKLLVPGLRRAVAFYDPNNRNAALAIEQARQASHQLGVKLLERRVKSVTEVQAAVRGLKAGEADAIFYVSDAMVASQAQFIADTAKAKKLPTMFHERGLVAMGALAGYGVSYNEVGRLSAKHVAKILAGVNPSELPVENVQTLEFVINLRTAHDLGLVVPPQLLQRADQVIE